MNPLRIRNLLLLSVWATACLTGFLILWDYSFTPGETKGAPLKIPAEFKDGRFHLLMSIHPRCPCTKASLAELSRILAKTKGKMGVSILVYMPRGEQREWQNGDLLNESKSIPAVSILSDQNGKIAESLGMTTSGAVCLYDKKGNLRYSGGITASRGHEGDNHGKSIILSQVFGKTTGIVKGIVYGCPIQNNPTDS